MKQKGFTLIELLAVIVILAIILAIAIPGIAGIINDATKSSFQSDAKMVLKAIDYKLLEDDTFDPTTITENNIANVLKLSGENYDKVVVTMVNNKPYVTITGQGKWSNLTAYGQFGSIKVVNTSDYDVTPPVITLSGTSPLTIEAGSTYTDTGATASDNHDGNITSKIIVVNHVNTSTTGTYTVTYNVSDAAGNAATQVTRTVTVTDAAKPVITMNGSSPTVIFQGSTYTDAGATATDNVDGDITSRIVKTGTVNTGTIGTYTINYNVSDSSGNAATGVSRTVNVVASVYTFDYTGSQQTFTAPVAGTYKLEVWGAQGGNSDSRGGYGGYAVGTYTLTASTTLYVYVGGQGNNSGYTIGWIYGGWNGGGGAHNNYSSSYTSASGGGSTDITTVSSSVSNDGYYRYVRTAASYNSRIIVAGGGGGGGSGSTGYYGGSGGGYQGATTTENSTGTGGTQTGPTSCSNSTYPSGLGYGGTKYYSSWGTGYCGGAGGGGYYGGCNNDNSCTAGGGGGGSGYIGGVSTSSTYGITKAMYCYNCPATTSTNIYTVSTTNYSSTATSNYAKSGNGYVKITYLGS